MFIRFWRYAKARLAERSTWQGISGAIAGSGFTLSGDAQAAVVSAGVALFALINILTPDKESA